MTISDLTTPGIYIIDETIDVMANFTIGAESVLIFKGGKFKNQTGSTIKISGDNITIKAIPIQIFDGDFDFRAANGYDAPNWTMERAYPQWFGAKSCATEAYSAYLKLKKITFAEVNNVKRYYVKDNYTCWAAEGLGKLNDIPDASVAINAAIRLKQRGEVFIPRGWYKISRHINVLPGIKLVGESTSDSGGFLNYGTTLFPWFCSLKSWKGYQDFMRTDPDQSSVDKSLTDFGFPIHPNQCSWYNNSAFSELNKETGYMIVTNLSNDSDKTKLNYTGSDAYPSSITYSPKQVTPPPETEIRDIRLVDLNNIYSTNYKVATHTNDGSGHPENFSPRGEGVEEWEKQNVHYHPLVEKNVIPNEDWNKYDYRFMRGILVAYSVHLKNVHVTGLSQAVCSISSFYADARHIEGCIFSPPHFNLSSVPSGYTDIVASRDYLNDLYPEKLYAFDFHSFGDALRFHGNHAVSYCDKIGALHLHNCNGGGVFDNILNSDSLIEMCRGISFDSNHIEYGANLAIRSSAVAVRKNFIWRGTRPAIYAYRYKVDWGLHFHSQLELSGNVFFITWPPEGLTHNASYPNVYDIATDCLSSISIDNCFRSSNKHLNGEGSYTGIRIGSFTLDGSTVSPPEDGNGSNLEAFTEFNNLSHIASINSHINGDKVTPMPFTMRRGDFSDDNLNIKTYTHDGSSTQWLDTNYTAGDTYSYKAWIFADFGRSIAFRGPVISLDNGNPLTNNGLKSIILLIGNGTDNDNWFGCDLHAGPFVIYVVRNRENINGIIQETKWLAFPVCSSTQFYDDGNYLSGYPWLSSAPAAESFLNALAQRPIESVKFIGENVECFCSSAVNLTHGTWRDGDVQYYPDGNDIRKRMYRDGAWHNMK